MPKPRRRETDYKIFVAELATHPDDLIISMAVMNRVVTPAGEYGQLTRDALAAEAERRGLAPVVDILAGAAIAQGTAMVEGDGERRTVPDDGIDGPPHRAMMALSALPYSRREPTGPRMGPSPAT